MIADVPADLAGDIFGDSASAGTAGAGDSAGSGEAREVLLTREVSAAGRNICRIDDNIVTLSELNRLSRRLADIHGQYDHQSLLDPASHIRLLDSYESDIIFPAREAVGVMYEQYTSLQHQLKTPLTLITGPLKQLLKRNTLKDSDKELLEIVDRNVSQLESLVSDVLNFRREVQNTVSDDSVPDEKSLAASKDIVHESHLDMLNQTDAEEMEKWRQQVERLVWLKLTWFFIPTSNSQD